MVRIWDASTAKLMRSFTVLGFEKGLNEGTFIHAFSPDGTLVALGGLRDEIPLYEMKTGKQVKRLKAPRLAFAVSKLAFSPDGRTLVSGDWVSGTVHLWELATGQHFHQYVGHKGRVRDLAFSADSSLLLTASEDTTALVWDMTGRLTAAKAAPLSAMELEARWADLAGEDAVRAQSAVRKLVTAPVQAVAFLGKQLKPAPAPDAKRIGQLIAELDSKQFKTREEAMRELEDMGDVTTPELQKAIDGNATLELKQRLQRLLEKFSSFQRLRTLRAVQALEQMGTPAAVALLERLAGGEPIALQTREALAAVNRKNSRYQPPRH